MVARAADLAGIPAHFAEAEYHIHPLWPRYMAIPQGFLDVLKGEDVFWITEEGLKLIISNEVVSTL